MNNINVNSYLVLSGITKSKLRHFIKNGLIIKSDGRPNKLNLTDTFSKDSVLIRSSFLLEGNLNGNSNLGEVFNTEFGADDSKLNTLLKASPAATIIQDVAQRHNLQYKLKFF